MRCFHEIQCNSKRNLRRPHAPVTASFPVSFTIRCSHASRKKILAISGCIQTDTQTDTDRQTDIYPPCGDRGGCNNGFASSFHVIPEMYVIFPLPYPSSPVCCTLLLPLSLQDSQNISSNDRYHHSLFSLDNNKTGIYLYICLFIYIFIYLFITALFAKVNKVYITERVLPQKN